MQPIYIGDTPYKAPDGEVSGEFTELLGEPFYCIQNYDAMPPFLMSLASRSDHWLFISSNGGLTAGRAHAEQALFPYYTEDKLADHHEQTGSKTILRVRCGGRTHLWEPFSPRHAGSYHVRRAIYKDTAGTAVVFEEVNRDLGLAFRYAWRLSDRFGFVRTAWLANIGSESCHAELLDGLQNILPANVGSQVQNAMSVLLDAYKRAELHHGTGLGIFSLSSTLSDLPEPSESLLATTVALVGLQPKGRLLSSAQLDGFRCGGSIEYELDVRGRRGAYFVHAALALEAGRSVSWHLVADVSQDHTQVAALQKTLGRPQADLSAEIEADIAENRRGLGALVGHADGLQATADRAATAHHFANTMFNIMRGGVFPNQYRILKTDLKALVKVRSRAAYKAAAKAFDSLPEEMTLWELREWAEGLESGALSRLCGAYLPLTFSRRHGDPSRPWNTFSIQVADPHGTPRFGYEGNWRDIFQNWEALGFAFPEYIESMINTFLNATTADGYNPYRITHEGIGWEKPEPDNPWANIGYWSDHQVIYLLKLMEAAARMHPGRLEALLDRRMFAYANVPYRIKPYESLVHDPHDTIEFDWALDEAVEARVAAVGTDGKLVAGVGGEVLHVSLAEKLLGLLLAKLVNFVPEGGIWMNTQRPEWNDANNALVGWGMSVVTLGYLRRFTVFFRELIAEHESGSLPVSVEVEALFRRVAELFKDTRLPAGPFGDEARRRMMDRLGEAGSHYRAALYDRGLSGEQAEVPAPALAHFLADVQAHLEHALRANRRDDGLYHAYNILSLGAETAGIERLDLMLEGQVSILSSGLLDGAEALQLVRALRGSELYRADQDSYLLYPNRALKGFLAKNVIPAEEAEKLALIARMLDAGDHRLVTRDVHGAYHFNGVFRNRKGLERTLETLREDPAYRGLVEAEAADLVDLFVRIFDHKRFTGRAGTFFAYEGLGSIYWHMVSKLLLAVQENALRFKDTDSGPGLRDAYRAIRAGLGFNKSPAVYGAFPADPYSHTPFGRGAQQPGMTGAVKEELLTRVAELGLAVQEGQFAFDFTLFDRRELLQEPTSFTYQDVRGEERQIALEPGSLAYTICQVPVVVRADGQPSITVHRKDGAARLEGHVLDEAHSRNIMRRDGVVERLEVSL